MLVMTPEVAEASLSEEVVYTDEKELPSLTWWVNPETNRVEGRVDGLEAMRQAIDKALRTERFEHLIYSWNYGFELNSILGQSRELAEAELPRLVREALSSDGRILGVENFSMERRGRDELVARFDVKTLYGETAAERSVTLHG